MDDYGIDTHKLMYHPERVVEWLEHGDCYPIYIEISPSGMCNHRCIFCALEYTEYKNPFLDTNLLVRRLEEMSELGVKAVMFAGEGEPLLHSAITTIIAAARSAGLDVSVTTNGVLIPNKWYALLDNCTWIRLSIDAGTRETYSNIHMTPASDFDRVIYNLTRLVEVRALEGYKCTIGAQLLLLRKNVAEVFTLGDKLREIGIDYLSIKPYSQHPLSSNKVEASSNKFAFKVQREALQGLETEKFKVIYREQAMKRVGTSRSYEQCLGLPFFCYISSLGEVYPCSTFLGKPEYIYGNIYNNTFKEIWSSDKRRQVIELINKDMLGCRENCRLDPINQYLRELKHPDSHVNFI